MKRISLLLIVVLALPFAMQGQRPGSSQEAVAMADRFVSNYDSLLNTYVMTKYAKSTRRHHANINSEYAFDQIPDSVLAKRLRNMHTVIPMTYNSVVRSYIRMYLNRMGTRLDVMLTLAEYYQPIFEEALARWNVPEELKYLTIVESAMNPQATSRVGAAGLWQFMYTTGKNYDLEVNSLVDERRDAYKSTDAAAHYIHDLYKVFGDWQLAIAAYNCGPGNITKAITRSGGKRNFWQIYNFLPKETRGYIPAFIAASYVMTYYPEHGLHPHKVTIPLRTDTIMVERNMLFTYVSKYTGVAMDELRTLNPQYRADMIPGQDGSYPLCLPIDKMNSLIHWADTIFAYSEDSLAHRLTQAKSQSTRKDTVGEGGDESIDNASERPNKPTPKTKKKKKEPTKQYHKVRRGENLTKIANRYGTTVDKIKKLNGIKGDKIRDGQSLRVK